LSKQQQWQMCNLFTPTIGLDLEQRAEQQKEESERTTAIRVSQESPSLERTHAPNQCWRRVPLPPSATGRVAPLDTQNRAMPAPTQGSIPETLICSTPLSTRGLLTGCVGSTAGFGTFGSTCKAGLGSCAVCGRERQSTAKLRVSVVVNPGPRCSRRPEWR